MRVFETAIAVAVSGCTFAGLGDYDVKTCPRPRGASTTIATTGAANDVAFSGASGTNVIGAFTIGSGGGSCVSAVDATAAGKPTDCSFLGDEPTLAPRQPTVVPLHGGQAAAIVATTAPCTTGSLLYRYSNAKIVVGRASVPCGTSGTALPALAPLGDDGAVVAWFATPFSSRADAVGGCTAAAPARLRVAYVTSASGSAPAISADVSLSDQSISVRPPALVALAGGTQAVLAVPHEEDVGVWVLGPAAAPAAPLRVPALKGARAVVAATAGDRIALVAEIGCSPQRIVLAVGSLKGGFASATVVADPDGSPAVAPAIAWVASTERWNVSWLSATGGAHVLTRSFSADGTPLGATVDTATPATAAAVTSGGEIIAYSAQNNSFANISLGCSP